MRKKQFTKNGYKIDQAPPPPVPMFDPATGNYVMSFKLNAMSLRQAVKDYLSEKKLSWSQSTSDHADKILNRIVAFCEKLSPPVIMVHELAVAHLAEFYGRMVLAYASRRGYTLRTITFLNWCVKKRAIPFECAEPIILEIYRKKKADPMFDPLTREQITRIVHWLVKRLQTCRVKGYRNLMIFRCLYDACMRADEVCRLRICDVHFDSGKIFITRKGNKTQFVEVSEDFMENMRGYMALRKSLPGAPCEPDSPLFPYTGKIGRFHAPTPDNLYSLTVMAFKVCDIKRTSKKGPHILRHSGATHKAEDGWPIHELKVYLGHESIATTIRYLHAADPTRRQCVEKRFQYKLILGDGYSKIPINPNEGAGYANPPVKNRRPVCDGEQAAGQIYTD